MRCSHRTPVACVPLERRKSELATAVITHASPARSGVVEPGSDRAGFTPPRLTLSMCAKTGRCEAMSIDGCFYNISGAGISSDACVSILTLVRDSRLRPPC